MATASSAEWPLELLPSPLSPRQVSRDDDELLRLFFDSPEDEREPEAEGAGAGVARLRCIDSSHPPDCTACCSPPTDWKQGRFWKLGSSPTRLRELVLQCPEWTSDADRARFEKHASARAAAAAAADQPEERCLWLQLANVLRKKLARELNKDLLFRLCHLWGYRSDIWRRSSRRRRRRQPHR